MAACEPCWNEAYRQSRLLGGSQVDHYRRLLEALDGHPHDADTPDAPRLGSAPPAPAEDRRPRLPPSHPESQETAMSARGYRQLRHREDRLPQPQAGEGQRPAPVRASERTTVTDNAECAKCGVTAADLPYEDLGMTLEQASEFLFDHDGNTVLCQGCS